MRNLPTVRPRPWGYGESSAPLVVHDVRGMTGSILRVVETRHCRWVRQTTELLDCHGQCFSGDSIQPRSHRSSQGSWGRNDSRRWTISKINNSCLCCEHYLNHRLKFGILRLASEGGWELQPSKDLALGLGLYEKSCGGQERRSRDSNRRH